MSTATFHLQAMSLALPDMGSSHPNRKNFEGILTKIGEPSDSAPSGSGGRRVLITPAAAEQAIPSLLGMGVNLTEKMDGHAPTAKIGVITSAEVRGSDLMVAGILYCADFPEATLRVNLLQAQLGMSFEARNLSVEDSDADPLVINSLYFTGASILMKDRAAYRSTRLAAMAAMAAIEKENDDMTPEELKSTLTDVVAGALAPVNTAISALQASQTVLTDRVAGFGAHIEAQQARMAKVEPAAASLEKTALAMEAAGVTDQAQTLRQMAAAMRSDAAAGREPQPFQVQAPAPQQQAAPVAPKFEDSDGYKALQAQLTTMTASLAAAADKTAAAETKIADLKAAADLAKAAPDRKTLPPMIANLVAKAGIEMPGDGEGPMNMGKLNQVLAASGLTTDQRMTLKTGLAKAGIVNLNTTAQ
jgi:hypothetical protein